MQIQISTDHNIECHEALGSRVRDVVETALSRNSAHITRVEIHMSDESSNKKGSIDVMRCVMEARLERHQPIAVTHRAETLDHAVHGAWPGHRSDDGHVGIGTERIGEQLGLRRDEVALARWVGLMVQGERDQIIDTRLVDRHSTQLAPWTEVSDHPGGTSPECSAERSTTAPTHLGLAAGASADAWPVSLRAGRPPCGSRCSRRPRGSRSRRRPRRRCPRARG